MAFVDMGLELMPKKMRWFGVGVAKEDDVGLGSVVFFGFLWLFFCNL